MFRAVHGRKVGSLCKRMIFFRCYTWCVFSLGTLEHLEFFKCYLSSAVGASTFEHPRAFLMSLAAMQ